jgi:YhcG PDDEXK nuclease domain
VSNPHLDWNSDQIRQTVSAEFEPGSDFTFVGRQRRLRIDQTWYRVDLLLFQRRLRCLVNIDLKLSSLTHAAVGQMHMYSNYAKENWTLPDENPPVGLILCSDKAHALARYVLAGLPNKIMAANYKTVLPNEEMLQNELAKTKLMLESHKMMRKRILVIAAGAMVAD